MPTPRSNESENDFIKRCIPIVLDDGTAKDGDQAYAICKTKYSDKEQFEDELKIKEFLIDDDRTIDAIAVTTKPAIQIDYVAFSEQEFKQEFTILNEEEQIFAGPLMVPEKLMKRQDPVTGEIFLGKFSAETIKKISERFFYKGVQKNINKEHKEPIYNDVSICEAWLIEDDKMDKAFSEKYGYKNLPVGTWMGKLKVFNKELWTSLKEGGFKGFSVEGYFNIKQSSFEETFSSILNNDDISDEGKITQLADLLNIASTIYKI